MKKEFKAESKRLMELMINSIYTNKEIFLREIISNASDAIDKLHYKSLTDKKIKVAKKDFAITILLDKEKRLLTIKDNGIGMNKEELENNLGTIAKSGSYDFKNNNKKKNNIDIIGQFGVGFYSAFMVASKVTVISKAYQNDEAYNWTSSGIEGYSITKDNKDNYGTDVILTIKEGEEYDRYLDAYEIQNIIKKYSDYITYPIKMKLNDEEDFKTINSLVPIWKRNKKDIKEEEYNTFYSDKFFDYEKPLKYLHIAAEGKVEYNALLYIPSHAPYDFYSKEYEKGLQLYSNGVLIMEKCSDLIPDYFSFVKGVVDSSDLSLNISREMLQQDRLLKTIANNIEQKIKSALEEMKEKDIENYLKFYENFGLSLKVGIYNDFGMNKDKLQDLLMFYSSKEEKLISLKDYVEKNKDEKEIYYACGASYEQINMLPKVEALKDKDKEILYCIDPVDEFVFKTLQNYQDKEFKNVADDASILETEEEKEKVKKLNEDNKEMLDALKDNLKISKVEFTSSLKNHPVCLTSAGNISIEMEKTMSKMPLNQNISAEKIMQINENHPITKKLIDLYQNDKEQFQKYGEILYAQARLIEGLELDNPTKITDLICDYLAK